ncbi:DNA fragmentation factor subunit beta [Phyllobates terribilis]|uniref:DNA fragmentation factor subunit beta n=1 Tax=Phyllobates terribilis TaxID=111132 RepID=UPI003CCAC575
MGKRMKFFKIRTVTGTEKYGVGCSNMKELRKKGCAKFKLPPKTTRVCLCEDGTELSDEYLMSLADHTDLVLLSPGQTWEGYMVTDFDRLLNAIYTRQPQFIEAARKIQTDGQGPQMRKIIQDIIQNLDDNAKAEEREDDEAWFIGVEKRFKNKSSYMRESCKRRIRSYVTEVRSFDVDPAVKDEYEALVQTMHNALSAVDFNGSYFDRKEIKATRLCNAQGWFSCQGAFDESDCVSNHSINPYSNQESRIVFSTWNLDHVIEKKRTILPRLAKAVKKSKGRQINWEYFFDLLFTTKNLKLVQISCHKKTSHDRECDEDWIYTEVPAKRFKN